MIDKPIFDFIAKEGKPGIPVNVPDKKTLGLYLCNGPTNLVVNEEEDCNQIIKINFTGPVGIASALYYSLVFMLTTEKFNVAKVNEWIEISPTHPEYYQRTVSSKKQLEGQIKEGLASAASALADFELVSHDVRKYKEIMGYFARDEKHMLRAMFIDQVDVHTGPMSLISLAKRWPTIIADFQKLENETKIDDISAKLKDISKAEAVVLTTKNILYTDWIKSFKQVVEDRYRSLRGLEGARSKSVEEYRTWLKPYISRYKMMKLGGESSIGRANVFKSFADLAGMSTYSNGIDIWVWTALKPAEGRKKSLEKGNEDFVIDPYDSYVRENLILNDKTGLAKLYPWLKNERMYCPKCVKFYPAGTEKCDKCKHRLDKATVADEVVREKILPPWKAKEMALNPNELYYSFFVINVFRAGSKLPIGEIEDITFNIYAYAISQNIMLVKLLELQCREMEFERYIDEIIGVKIGEHDIADVVKKDFPELFNQPVPKTEMQKFSGELSGMFGKMDDFLLKAKVPKSGRFMFVKPGPYEADYADRITKYYLNVIGADFSMMKSFLKTKMGVG